MLEILVSLSLLFSHALAHQDMRFASVSPLRFFHGVGKPEPARFAPVDRAVSNWRREAVWGLSLAPMAMVNLSYRGSLQGVSRCVKLNNYWCIKKAGWSGEIASDAEGHVAFASALEGAKVAALLLRRYYMTYNLHSARDIVARWAPAQCGVATAPRALTVASRPNVVKFASRAPPALTSRALAPRGIQNTLRGRWLATHTFGGFRRAGKTAGPVRRSVVPDHLVKMMPAPEIAVGMGEHEIKLKPIELGKLDQAKAPALPSLSCAGDWPRIDAYAAHAAEGLAATPHDDLALFTDQGRPTPHLAKLMRNMAAVEIGPLGVRDWLIEDAIAAALPPTADAPR